MSYTFKERWLLQAGVPEEKIKTKWLQAIARSHRYPPLHRRVYPVLLWFTEWLGPLFIVFRFSKAGNLSEKTFDLYLNRLREHRISYIQIMSVFVLAPLKEAIIEKEPPQAWEHPLHDLKKEKDPASKERLRKIEEELKSLDFAYNFVKDGGGRPELRGTGVTIGTLKELFKSLPDSYFNIDIKVNSAAFVRDILELVREEGMLEKVVIGSFYDNIVDLVNREAGEFTTSASAREAWIIFLLNKIGLGRLHQPTGVAYQIPVTHKGMDVVTPSFVRTAHSLGQEVHVWTIDDPVEIRRLLEMGVDGIVTNRPDAAVEVVEEFRK